jgi:hypothetical protein
MFYRKLKEKEKLKKQTDYKDYKNESNYERQNCKFSIKINSII